MLMVLEPQDDNHFKKEEEEADLFYFLIASNYFTLNKLFCFYLTSFVHPKILTRFYSIYFKIFHKISAQFDGWIENYAK